MMDSLDDLLTLAKGVEARLPLVKTPPLLGVDPETVLEPLRNLERRVQEGPRAPVRIALFGPTGSGKSKLFNSLAGAPLSPSSYRRPFTRRPVYLLHQSRAAFGPRLGGEALVHQRPGWEDLILIDTPDFDSVEAENRASAAHIYLEADGFIFVADISKYADASVWGYLDRIRSERKRSVIVLNKVAGAGESPLEDFRARLTQTFRPDGPPGPVVAVGYFPQGDEELIAPDEPGLAILAQELSGFAAADPGGGRPLLVESFRIDLDRFLAAWDAFARPLREFRDGLARLGLELDARFEKAEAALSEDLEAELDPGLKGEVYRQVLKRIERMDVLRFPRRLLSLPAMGLKQALGRFWPKPGGGAAQREREDQASDAANLAVLERRIRDLSEETRAAIRSESACPGLLDEEGYRRLAPDHQEVRERYRAASEEFRAWASAQAGSAAATLTAEHKLKFVLSQVLYNTVVIGIQVKTGGAFSLSDMLTDGVLSPLVAKAVGMAVSSERVQEFEAEARREHARRLAEVLKETRDRFAGRFAESASGLSEIEPLGAEVARLRAARDRLVERFARGQR